MKEKMYIHSTDSSCEKTKQEKQKKLFNSLTEKTEKNPEKTKTARWKKLPHSPLKWKKNENLILTLCATNFYMPFVFFVMFYHTLLLPSTTLKTNKNSSKLLRFSLILFLIIQKLFLCFRKNCRKMLTMKGNQKFSLS